MQNENIKFLSSLNFLRAFSGYGVCVSHYLFFSYNIILFEFMSFIFVEFFFILSGYVLAPQLIKLNSIKFVKIFFYRRWIRTIPLFLLCLLVFSIFFKTFNIDTAKHLFLIQNFFPNFVNNNYVNILWSLSIEEYFYLLFPILLIIFSRVSFAKILIISIIFFLVLNFIFSFILSTSELRVNTFLRLDSIMYGVLLYLIVQNKIIFNIHIITFLFLPPLYFFYDNFAYKDFNSFETFFYILYLKILSIFVCWSFIKLEIFFLKYKKIGTLLANQTYSIYLFHMIFIYLLKFYELNFIFGFFIYMFCLFIFSFFIYNFFEKPLNDLRPKY